MMRYPSHRSSARRVLIGGTLAAALGGASTAWACTAQAGLTVSDRVGHYQSGPVNSTVAVTAEVPDAPAGATIFITDGNTVMGKATATAEVSYLRVAVMTAPLTVAGNYYFFSHAEDAAGNLIDKSERKLLYVVEKPAQALIPQGGDGPGSPADGSGSPADGPGSPAEDTGNPAGSPVPAPMVIAPAASTFRPPAGSPVDQAPASRQPAAPAPATAGMPATQSPTVPSAADLARPTPVPVEVAEPTLPEARRMMAPAASDLWSAVDPSAQVASLLDAPTSAPSGGGLPIGAGLLGIGVLALAGAGTVAGQRRLAVTRR